MADEKDAANIQEGEGTTEEEDNEDEEKQVDSKGKKGFKMKKRKLKRV